MRKITGIALIALLISSPALAFADVDQEAVTQYVTRAKITQNMIVVQLPESIVDIILIDKVLREVRNKFPKAEVALANGEFSGKKYVLKIPLK